MTRDTDKLAIQTADLALTTHKGLENQARRVDKLADTEGERFRAAAFASRLEGWASARLSPRNRRSGKLAAFDERIADLEARRAAITREANEIRERIPQAEAEHRVALARWHAEGSKGSRPDPEAPKLEAKARALEDDYSALEALLDEAFADKGLGATSDTISVGRGARLVSVLVSLGRPLLASGVISLGLQPLASMRVCRRLALGVG